METRLSAGWEEERVELRAELCRLQEELAESHAEREELQARAHALSTRLSETLDPAVSLHLDAEQKEWRRRLREGREREARQALLIHKLQNKVVEYRGRCERLEQQLLSEERELRIRERILRDERSDTLESSLIQLEEERQRGVTLVEVNALLRSQLSQSAEANQALQDDLQKLTADWSKAVEEAGQREIDWHKEKEALKSYMAGERSRLMVLWGGVMSLRRQCHAVKTATDRDLWELRAEFSRLSSTFLSASPPTATHSALPLSSTSGPLTLEELESEHRTHAAFTAVHEVDTQELMRRIEELMATIKAQDHERQRQEQERERCTEMERKLELIQQSLRSLCRELNLQRLDGQCIEVQSEDLSSVLDIIAQAETALQWRRQELQEVKQRLQKLREEADCLDQRVMEQQREREELQQRHTQDTLHFTHTESMLNRERETVVKLQMELKEAEQCTEELKTENECLRQQREREKEERSEVERDRERRVKEELLENAQLCVRERHSRLELQTLQGALERERLDRTLAEKESTSNKDALIKARESLVFLSSSNTLLKREAADTLDALEKIAALNESLAQDKRELCNHTLKLEEDVTETQIQLQQCRSEVAALRRELKAVSMEAVELRSHREAHLDSVQQLRDRERELERELQSHREDKERDTTLLTEQNTKNEELSEQHKTVCEKLAEVQTELDRVLELQKTVEREREELQREKRRLEQRVNAQERNEEELEQEREEHRDLSVHLQQELTAAQDQVSGLEVKCTQLQMQVHTLLQGKEVLQGEIQCLQAELKRGEFLWEQERQEANDERKRNEGEIEKWQAEFVRLQIEGEQVCEQHKAQEEEWNADRELWQRERESLSSELGQKDGEVEALKNRAEGLIKENKELSDLIDKKNGELEHLQSKLAAEHRALESRLWEANVEMERWKEKAADAQREKDELNQKFLERVERESEDLKITEKEKAKMADLLRKREGEIEKKEKEVEELRSKVRLQQCVLERHEIELKAKELLESKIAAMDELITQLKEKEIAKTKEEEQRQKEKEAEQRERERKLRGELKQKDVELEEVRERAEGLVMEKKHMSFLLEERKSDIEKLQNNMTREKKNLESVAREAKDEMEWWKRRAGDIQKEMEATERERNELIAVEREREHLKNLVRERDEEIEKMEEDIVGLKSTVRSLEGVIEKLQSDVKGNEALKAQLIVLVEKNTQLMENEEERLREWDKTEEENKQREKEMERELEKRTGEMSELQMKIQRILKERDDALDRLLGREADLQKLQARLTNEETTFKQRLMEKDEQKERWKTQADELRKEKMRLEEAEERRHELERESKERDEKLRAEMSQMEGEVKELQMKTAELDRENKETKRKILEQQVDLQKQAALLTQREEEVHRLKEALEERETEKNEVFQQGQDELKKLKEKLVEMERDYADHVRSTESVLEKERHLYNQKETELLNCDKKFQLARDETDQEKRKVVELEEKSKKLMKELEMLREQCDELSYKLEGESQLLQDGKEEIRILKIRVEDSEEEKRSLRWTLNQKDKETEELKIQLKDSRANEEKLKSEMKDLQQVQHSLVDNAASVEKLGADILKLEEERDRLSAELRRKEREVEAFKYEIQKEKQGKERISSSLKQKEEELKEAKERKEAMATQLEGLKDKVAALGVGKELARSVMMEHYEENKKIREGLKAGLQEMATLKELLVDSHREGECLRSIIQEKRDDLVKGREEGMRAAQSQIEDLLLCVQILKKDKQELQAKLCLSESEGKESHETAARERERTERIKLEMREEIKTLETIAGEKEAELDKARARIDVLEEQQREVRHAAAQKNREVETLRNSIKELEQKEKTYGLKKWQQKMELLKQENNDRQHELEMMRKKVEFLNKELREKKEETELTKKVNEGLKYSEYYSVKKAEITREKEARLERATELALNEGKTKKMLEKQLEDRKKETEDLKRPAKTSAKKKQEEELKGGIFNLREPEKNSSRPDKQLHKQHQDGFKDISQINTETSLWTETRDTTTNQQETEAPSSPTQSVTTDSLQPSIMRHTPDDRWEQLNKQMSSVLLEKEKLCRCLGEKESEVNILKERAEELCKDRDRVKAALENTESMLLHYNEKLQQQERSEGMGTEPAMVLKVSEVKSRSGIETDWGWSTQERLCAMQRLVAQLELHQRDLLQRNGLLERRTERLKIERQHLRDTLKQVELERGELRRQLSKLDAGIQDCTLPAGADELKWLKQHALALMEQLHHLRLMLAADHRECVDFIDGSMRNSKKLLSLRQELNASLAVVSQQLIPPVLESEAQRLHRSIREEDLKLSPCPN